MADPALKISAELTGLEKSAQKALANIERNTRIRIQVDDKASLPLGRISKNASELESSLDAATSRVLAFGAAAAVFTTIAKAFDVLVTSVIDVEESLAKINVNFGATESQLESFRKGIFDVARSTAKSFDDVAKAAEELSRQGLGAEETQKRLLDVAILSRRANITSAEAVDTLTAAVNSYQKAGLTTTQIVNKLVAVDTKFAVSSNDLSEAISRSASTAQEAGLSFDEFIGFVTAAQQTTARGGAVIGNAFKTILTRVQAAPETIKALEQLGVAITDSSGAFTSAGDRLRQYADIRKTLSDGDKNYFDRIIAGTQQINIFSAAITDLAEANGVAARAQKASSQATNEAIAQNDELNKSLQSILSKTGTNLVDVFSSVGQGAGNNVKFFLEQFNEALELIEGSKKAIQGFANVLSGPVLVGGISLLLKTFLVVKDNIEKSFGSLIGLNSASETRLAIEKQIAAITANATSDELKRLNSATSLAERRQAYLAIEQRVTAELAKQAALNSSLSQSFVQYNRVKPGGIFTDLSIQSKASRVRGGYPSFADPLRMAIEREKKSGVPANQIYVDTDPRLKGPGNPLGLLVANKIDEPLGGFQGVNRALREGANPKTYGKNVPNFATFNRVTDSSLKDKFGVLFSPSEIDFVNSQIAAYGAALSDNNDFLRKLAKQNLKKFVTDEESFTLIELALQEEKKAAKIRKKENKRREDFLKNQPPPIDLSQVKIIRNGGNPNSTVGPQTLSSNYPLSANQQVLVNQANALLKKPKFSDVTFREVGLKKQLTGLSENQLFDLLDKSGVAAGKTRLEDVNSLRKILAGNSLNKDKSINRDVIEQTIGLARSGTLATDFEETVKKLVKRGSTLEDAYEKASEELVISGGTSRQLSRIQLGYAQTLSKFEKDVENQRDLAEKASRLSNSEIKVQTLRNQTTKALAVSQGDLSKLSRKQQAILLSGLRAEAKQELGFGGFSRAQLSQNSDAQQQIDTFVGKRLSEIQTSLRKVASETARVSALGTQTQRIAKINQSLSSGLGGLLGTGIGGRRSDLRNIKAAGPILPEDKEIVRRILNERSEKRFRAAQTASLGAAFVAPFAAGFVPEGQGGTGAGIGLGAASGTLQGAGIGAIFGPYGAGVGAALGGLAGAFNKLKKSAEEVSKSFDKGIAENTESLSKTEAVLSNRQKIEDLSKSGGDPRLIARLQAANIELSSGIPNPRLREAVNLGSSVEELTKIMEEVNRETSRQQAVQSLAKLGEVNEKNVSQVASLLSLIGRDGGGAIDPAGAARKFLEANKNPANLIFEEGDGFTNVSEKDELKQARENLIAVAELSLGRDVVKTLGSNYEALAKAVEEATNRTKEASSAQKKLNNQVVNLISFSEANFAPDNALSGFGSSLRTRAFNFPSRKQNLGEDLAFLESSKRLEELGVRISDPEFDKELNRAKARSQKEQALFSAREFLSPFANQRQVNLNDDFGQPNQLAIAALLKTLSGSTDKRVSLQSTALLKALQEKDSTVNSLIPGLNPKYSTFAPSDQKNRSFLLTNEQIEAGKESASKFLFANSKENELNRVRELVSRAESGQLTIDPARLGRLKDRLEEERESQELARRPSISNRDFTFNSEIRNEGLRGSLPGTEKTREDIKDILKDSFSITTKQSEIIDKLAKLPNSIEQKIQIVVEARETSFSAQSKENSEIVNNIIELLRGELKDLNTRVTKLDGKAAPPKVYKPAVYDPATRNLRQTE